MPKRIYQLFCAIVFCTVTISPSFAQSSAANYPNKVVTLVVPFTSGSGSDTISRIISPKLSERWKQPVIVDNRAGASGNIGTDHAAKATPDGYTILMAIDTMTMTPAVYKTLPFDPIKDLDPIARLATSSYALAVTNTLPVKDVNSLLALIKSKPGQLNYGSPGNGTPHHLSMELLKSLKGIDIVHVPYKGIAGATTDLIGGQVQVMFATFNSMIPFAKAGKLKMIAVTGAKRSDLMPDVPTFTEQGIPELENLYPWYGVLVPAGTPKDIQNKIYNDYTAVMKLPEVEKQLNDLGIQVRLSTGDQLKDIIQSDIARWKKVVKDANIQAN
ncbi:MFS transporter [Polynucleobacter sp. SHI8]|uniref:Bug family tripartite tricarboxylate transporter substrate binding protein n=1 Tax=unclassified Polynucleobacter TaxID=2640945 RepID=UPI00249361E7|nr:MULTISPECIES: tripartite tricarboxylate transporter substrate binding protein [unclassified Polynucleobacter]BDW10309.1 MFS transporter [Polynucleobacter sp. SHI2]BDW12755.1 MFS transporter [Polynucleobacter sp. SHI8]